MKPNFFFTLMRMLLSAVLLVSSTLLFTGCPSVGSLCPDRTCNDLALLATAVDNGATANYKLTFQDIGLNDTYNVEAVDSATSQVLYSSIGTTSRTHSFSRPFSWRTVKWTVTVMYCTDPQKTFTCTTYSKIDGGGITVIVVERTTSGTCNKGLPLNSYPTTYQNSPNDLPILDVECYKGNSPTTAIGAQSSEDIFLSLFAGQSIKIVLATTTNKECLETIKSFDPTPHNIRRTITNKQELHQAIHGLLSDQFAPVPYGLNYAGVSDANKRVVRFLRYQ